MQLVIQMLIEAADQSAQSKIHVTLSVSPAVLVVHVGHPQTREPRAFQDVLELHADLKIELNADSRVCK